MLDVCVLRAAGGVNEGRGGRDGLGLPLLDDIAADEEWGGEVGRNEQGWKSTNDEGNTNLNIPVFRLNH